jgi:hypothetical protein
MMVSARAGGGDAPARTYSPTHVFQIFKDRRWNGCLRKSGRQTRPATAGKLWREEMASTDGRSRVPGHREGSPRRLSVMHDRP